MILHEIFLQLREKAIDQLDDETRYDSFGYHIDVTNAWENIYNTTELLSYLSIHNTHAAKYSELCFHISDQLEDLQDQLNLHFTAVENVGRVINTAASYSMPDIKYDLLEMAVDWLFLRKYCENIRTVVDFGAGCGRQIVGCYQNLTNFKNYIGIDASLNGYVVQNAFYNTFALMQGLEFCDLLDYQSSNIDIDIRGMLEKDNLIMHCPAWVKYDVIEDRSIDLILACHVHNELSHSDFLRLMELVSTKLSDNGIFYVRSELGIWADPNYEDKVKYHAIDPVEYLAKKGLKIIETEYFGGFMTTIFARNESSHVAKIKKSKTFFNNKTFETLSQKANKIIRGKDNPVSFAQIMTKIGIPAEQLELNDNKLPHLGNFKEVAFYCAAQYAFDELSRIIKHYGSLQYIDDGFSTGTNILKYYSEQHSLIEIKEIKDVNHKLPLVINSVDFHKHESQIPAGSYQTRLHYTYPFVMLLPDLFNLETTELLNT